MWIDFKDQKPFVGKEIDVWAKRWESRDDSFEYRRFTSCRYFHPSTANIPDEWFATHWMYPPEPPK